MNNNIWKRNEKRAEDNTENRAGRRAEKRAEIKTENKTEKGNENRAKKRTEHRTEHRSENRNENKSENKSGNRNEYRSEDRSGNRSENRSENKNEYRSGNRNEYRSEDRSGNRSENKNENRSENKNEYRSENRSENRNENRNENKNEYRSGNKNGYRSENKIESRIESRIESGNEEKGRISLMDEVKVQDTVDDAGIIEGRNPVLEALKSDRTFNKILISKGEKEGSIKQIIALAKDKGIVIQEVDRVKLDSMSFTHAHQGVIAFASVKDYVELDDILKIAESKGEPPFIVILDEITDSYNLGSMLRTANASGAHGVIIPKRRAVGLNTAVSKASAGAVEYVPVARVTNISQTIEYLKKKNIWVVGTDSSGEKTFYDSDLKGAIALVIGSEGEGIGKLVLEKCDFVVNIPMKGQIASLNAAVAGAIVMYEILKQRTK